MVCPWMLRAAKLRSRPPSSRRSAQKRRAAPLRWSPVRNRVQPKLSLQSGLGQPVTRPINDKAEAGLPGVGCSKPGHYRLPHAYAACPLLHCRRGCRALRPPHPTGVLSNGAGCQNLMSALGVASKLRQVSQDDCFMTKPSPDQSFHIIYDLSIEAIGPVIIACAWPTASDIIAYPPGTQISRLSQ